MNFALSAIFFGGILTILAGVLENAMSEQTADMLLKRIFGYEVEHEQD